jgi:glycosyltransferase involved in cell wall biosynthesis
MTVTSDRSPKVSIIIPAYNTAGLIPHCLNSVLAQTYSDFEAIVVNDGSPDTPELEKALEPYLNRIVYIKQENKRCAGARNTAIRHARGEFLAFLDSDDIWFPEHLASQMKLLEQDPSLDMVFSNAQLMGDPKGRDFMQKCPTDGMATFDAIVHEKCHISVSTVVIRKSVVVNAGGFDETLARCDDYDMWLRGAFEGAKIGFNRDVQAKLNGGRPGSLGESRAKMAEAYWLILEKAIRTLPLDTVQRDRLCHRAADIKARYLLEEGKNQLTQGRLDKATQLFSEANKSFRRSKVSMALIGLSIAPNISAKVILLWNRLVNQLSSSA